MRGMRPGVIGDVKASSELSSEMNIFSVKSQCLKGGGVHTGFKRATCSQAAACWGGPHFKYLCRYVSELKWDLMPMKLSSLVHYFFGKGRDPASKNKG